jgi:hypothetical protein
MTIPRDRSTNEVRLRRTVLRGSAAAKLDVSYFVSLRGSGGGWGIPAGDTHHSAEEDEEGSKITNREHSSRAIVSSQVRSTYA